MPSILIFGLGYSATVLAARLRREGWQVMATRREAGPGVMAFHDEDSVRPALASATHILSSVPPGEAGDPVLERYGSLLGGRWTGYFSSTGVYGDTGGAWVDETASASAGRRATRAEADQRWLAHGAIVFRLPGIYGPGRSAIERVLEGRANRIDLRDQVFSRIHVDDIASGVVAAFKGPPGAYNLADDRPSSQNEVVEEACRLLGHTPPPLQTLEEAGLSNMARGFYAENRRVANGKAYRLLGWRPRYRDFKDGLAACLARSATINPSTANPQPAPAESDQR